jgi:hypothetical protein
MIEKFIGAGIRVCVHTNIPPLIRHHLSSVKSVPSVGKEIFAFMVRPFGSLMVLSEVEAQAHHKSVIRHGFSICLICSICWEKGFCPYPSSVINHSSLLLFVIRHLFCQIHSNFDGDRDRVPVYGRPNMNSMVSINEPRSVPKIWIGQSRCFNVSTNSVS